jgi:hypothetical protein
LRPGGFAQKLASIGRHNYSLLDTHDAIKSAKENALSLGSFYSTQETKGTQTDTTFYGKANPFSLDRLHGCDYTG